MSDAAEKRARALVRGGLEKLCEEGHTHAGGPHVCPNYDALDFLLAEAEARGRAKGLEEAAQWLDVHGYAICDDAREMAAKVRALANESGRVT